MQQETYDVAVVGAGIAGCAVAYHVARAGLKVALLEKGSVAGEASQAGAGMLAPLSYNLSGPLQPFQQIYFAGLEYYQRLDQELKQETGIDIELVDAPTLRVAFDQQDVAKLQNMVEKQRHLLPGLQWLEADAARKVEPLLPETVCGAVISPEERNVQVTQVTKAYARGAVVRGAALFGGRPVGRLIRSGPRVVGVETEQGPVFAEIVVLAAGAWSSRWHVPTATPPIFPVKGQMLAVQPPPDLLLRHTMYAHGIGGILPKADGRIFVGATHERVGFEKAVTIEGLAHLLTIVAKLAPQLKRAQFEQAWAGLRPGTADDLPLLGPSQSMQGLWLAGGLYMDGILLGPVIGHILAELLQGHATPFGLDLTAFDPDRFGGWDTITTM